MGNFRCRDKGVESFLKNNSLDFEQRNFARTYLLLDAIELVNNNVAILAYFTLSIKALHFLPNISKHKVKEIDGFSKDASSVGAVLIGQFGKDEFLGHNLSGADAMSFAIDFTYDIFEAAACRFAFLECQPIDKLIDFYKSFGFEPLQTSHNGLLQMIRFL
jgi:hypothetical protein